MAGMSAEDALALAKSYVKKTMEGGGATSGKNVIIKSIVPIDGGNRITFSYTLNDGTEQTSTLDVMNGVDGKDGVSATITVNENEDGTITLGITDENGTKETPNIKGEKGEQGLQGEKGESGEKGEPGKDGRSITGIKTDDKNNVIVTFSDKQEQNIGQLAIDVQGDFLTEGGFGNLRYYQGKFQYFDEEGQNWVDTSVSPKNPIIMQMMPQEMQYICCVYDKSINRYKLKWIEPKDTVLEGQNAVSVEKVVIRRKQYEDPIGISDGYEVTTIPRSSFGSYANEWYIDFEFEPNSDEVWYYKAFPVSTSGFINTSELNSAGGVKAKDYALYGFKIGQIESDPPHMITYLPECDNTNFRSAHMNYDTGKFDYGDFTPDSGAWFMDVKPCLQKKNGSVYKFLNPDNLEQDADGGDTSEDIKGTGNDYNVMNQNPFTSWLIHDNGDETANIYFSDARLHYDEESGQITKCKEEWNKQKVKGDFVFWSNLDEKGDIIPYFYTPAYNGSAVGNVLRSLSGQTPINSKTAQAEIDYAKANNEEGSNIWYTEVYCDRVLINLLLILIGKSTDTQTVFGQGYHTGGSSASNLVKTGGMNQKGLFWGTNTNSSTGVKVFGMEHYWGNQWRRIAGWMLNHSTQKVKMTYGQSDGSKADGYNLTGQDYIEIQGSTPTGTTGGYISKCLFTENGIIPVTASGTSNTYYTDGLWFNVSQVDYALVGGASNAGLPVGALCASLAAAASYAYWDFGAALSCKPLAQKG